MPRNVYTGQKLGVAISSMTKPTAKVPYLVSGTENFVSPPKTARYVKARPGDARKIRSIAPVLVVIWSSEFQFGKHIWIMNISFSDIVTNTENFGNTEGGALVPNVRVAWIVQIGSTRCR